MFNTMYFLGLAYLAAGGIYGAFRHLQMLQQNSYYPSRYYGWLSGSISVSTVIAAIAGSAAFLIASLTYEVFFMIYSLALALIRINHALSVQKKSIKKLVFTSRIKRLILTMSLLSAVIVLVCTFLPTYYSFIPAIMFFASPAMVMLAWCINYFPEKLVANYYVKDAKKILAESNGLKVIGITGSYGKTGTKFILSKLLARRFNVVATPGSFNTTMGVVRTVREHLKHDTQIFICEMGAKNIGDVREICEITKPDIGLITSVGPQHLETFKTVDNVFSTKFELYDAVSSKGGKCFINGDSKAIAERADKIGENAVIFGTNEGSGCRISNLSFNRYGSQFDLKFPNGESVNITTPLLGRHNAVNFAGAAAVANALGVENEEIAIAASRLKATEHRLELKSWVNGAAMIDDAYNANPEGCIEAVSVLNSFKGMKKIIITPGLVELGKEEYRFNYNLGTAAAKVCDMIILVGKKRSVPMKKAAEDAGYPADKLFVVSSFADAVKLVSPYLDSETVVLIENDLPDNYAE